MTTVPHDAASAGGGPRAVEDRATRQAIADAREYQRLWPRAEPVELDFADYLDEVCRDVALASGTTGSVRLVCTVTDGLLPNETAVQLGRIADELIEDALQHGCPPGGGRIAVSFSARRDAWVLTVEDSGVGLPPGTATSAGLRFVGGLTTLLGGEFVVADLVPGTRCVVTLPRR